MKIGNRYGHTEACTGANDAINELKEARNVLSDVNYYLKQFHTIINCHPGKEKGWGEWNIGVATCNRNNCELFFSIHFNADSKKKAEGCEIVIAPGDSKIISYANRVLSNLESLGFKNRGIKYNSELAETVGINCPSMIIEICFVHEKDAAKYKSIGYSQIAKAVANGIDSRILFKEVSNENKNEEVVDVLIFNEEWYLKQYPEVKKAVDKKQFKSGLDHYNKCGKLEKNRLPIPPIPLTYNEGIYRLANKSVDVAIEDKKFFNGMDHYIKYGWKENRMFCMPLGWCDEEYSKCNPGLKESCNKHNPRLTLKEHYILYGKNEGRKYK